jgi:hypothetical protein
VYVGGALGLFGGLGGLARFPGEDLFFFFGFLSGSVLIGGMLGLLVDFMAEPFQNPQ